MITSSCMYALFFIFFIIMDVIYFIWFFTLHFSLPNDIISSVRKAIIGSIDDLKIYVNNKLRFRKL